MHIKDFLTRIDFQGDPAVSYDCLSTLQYNFLHTVPFENIDIMNKVALNLSIEGIYHKVVQRGRGGICFENNALFCWALRKIGFAVKIVAAEMFPSDSFRNHFDHMALWVTLDDNDYLVDVGNGKYFGKPLAINSKHENTSEGVRYTIAPYGKGDNAAFALCFFDEGRWKYRYAFTSQAKSVQDFQRACHFTETSPASAFTGKRLVTILRGQERITLSGQQLSVSEADQKQSTRNLSTSEVNGALQRYFGIVL